MIALILAAGNSSRFLGENKLLLPVRGIPILQSVVHALDHKDVSEIRIVTGKFDRELREAISNPKIEWIHNKDYSEGMSSSIRTGLQMELLEQVIITPGDMPFFKKETVGRLISNHTTGTISIPTYQNRKGHPIILDQDFVKNCLEESSEKILYTTIQKSMDRVRLIDTQDKGILIDVDSPEEYLALKNI